MAKVTSKRRRTDGPPSLQQIYDREQDAKRVALDRGARGRAMKVRPKREIETMAAGVKVVQMEDTDILAMAVEARCITVRQQDALAKLAEQYSRWKTGPRVVGGYGRTGGAPELTAAQEKARQSYNAMLAAVPGETRHALAIVACGEWPVMGNALGLVRRGADALAIHLRIPRANDA